MDTAKLNEMTKEEACEVLDDMKVKIDIPHAAVMQRKRNEALDMGISALSENKVASGEYIRKTDMERILYSTNNAIRIGEEFLELPTYSFPDSVENKDSVFKGMTNGEVIKALFPYIEVSNQGVVVRVKGLDCDKGALDPYRYFWMEWWNAPYQKGGK